MVTTARYLIGFDRSVFEEYLRSAAPRLAKPLNSVNQPTDGFVDQWLIQRCHELLARDSLPVVRKKKNQTKSLDIRPFFKQIDLAETEALEVLELVGVFNRRVGIVADTALSPAGTVRVSEIVDAVLSPAGPDESPLPDFGAVRLALLCGQGPEYCSPLE